MSKGLSRRKGLERLVDLFKAEGVEVISGIVDVYFMDFHRATIASGIKMIGTRHEVATVMVGDVITANEENVPMIVLDNGRGFHTRSVVRNNKFQYWSQLEMFKQICKWAAVVQGMQ